MSATTKDAKGIFLAAIQIGGLAEQAAFVARSCGDDATLRQRVEDLLRAFGQPGGPVDPSVATMAATKTAELVQEEAGSTIGPYKLMEQIGEGGFGLVFVAEQQQPIRRKVALKIIKPGMDSRDVIARFEAERQALALMDHPNIARVLDAGTTQSGHPYFVMELVRGLPITEYCDKHQLTPRERLALFVPICNAIQHAHLKGIIHRDIKPSNVLVTMHDGKPVVKVIDFGVAKALHQSLSDRTVYTRFAQMIGTPLYMSPEQAEMNGLDIDTRTDVYSLGVLLYELLTGMTPFDKKRLAEAAYGELLKIIREEEPPKPSLRISQSNELASIAALRKTEPARLSHMFRGDLDWITMKALEKDRTRRYETANAFAADVSRHLSDDPVEACPPSTAYRLRKFARKHRKPVVASLTVASLLLLGIAGTTWGLFRARRAEQAASRSEQRVLEAFGRVTQERDAKEQARSAEARARERAERELAIGLLRPIGFYNQPTDPAELRSFVDLSALQSRLKSRVLEIALEEPDTALRAARRAERLIQACVGLSPARRARAIELVARKQRDLTTDARIRVAACWLALELGSKDLPAWEEGCNYLADSTDTLDDSVVGGVVLNRFGEFLALATSRKDPEQIAQLNAEPLLALLEKSADFTIWQDLCEALVLLVPRLDQAQTARTWGSMLAMLKKPAGDFQFCVSGTGLFAALAPRLETTQVKRGWDILLKGLETNENSTRTVMLLSRNRELSTLAPRMEEEQVDRAMDAVIGIPGKPRLPSPPVGGLRWLAPRLSPQQAKRAWDSVILDMTTGYWGQGSTFAALAPKLDRQDVQHGVEGLISMLDKAPDPAEQGLAALAPRLDRLQVERTADRLIGLLAKSTNGKVFSATCHVLKALAPQLAPAQAQRAWDAVATTLERKDALSSLAGEAEVHIDASPALAALVPKLDPAQIKRMGNARIEILEKSRESGPRFASLSILAALAPQLGPAQVRHAGDALIAIVGEPAHDDTYRSAVVGLVALAPRLEPAQLARAWTTLIAIRDQLPVVGFRMDPAWEGLAALASQLEPASRNERSAAATAELLDFCCSIFPYDESEGWSDDPNPMSRSIAVARSISAVRSLGRLLSHPGCVGEQREYLLQRFEELAFYRGESVLLKPETPENRDRPGNQLAPRRFHYLHDAAAWIQKNLPDFDLESNYPATWRGSR